MKKIILLIIVISLSSCNVMDMLIDSTTYSLLENVEFYDFADYDISRIETFVGIAAFSRNHISYRDDFVEDFTSPKKTLKRGYGDCDEYAFIFMNLSYVLFDIKMDMVIVNTGRTIEDGGIGDHINVRYKDIVYNAQTGYKSTNQTVLYSYTFNEVF